MTAPCIRAVARVVLVQMARTALAVVVVALLAVFAFLATGREAHVVMSGSMTPALRPGDVMVSRAPDGDLSAGQIVLVRPPAGTGRELTHRLVEVRADGYVVTRGDANGELDAPVPVSWVQGVGVVRIPGIGLLTVWLHERDPGALALAAGLLAAVTWGATRPTSRAGSGSRVGQEVPV